MVNNDSEKSSATKTVVSSPVETRGIKLAAILYDIAGDSVYSIILL